MDSGEKGIIALMNRVDVLLVKFRDGFIDEREFMVQTDAIVRENETLWESFGIAFPEQISDATTTDYKAQFQSSLLALQEYSWGAASA